MRGIERDVLPTCERYGMGVIPWSPLSGGLLSGRHRTDNPEAGSAMRKRVAGDRFDRSNPANAAKWEAVDALTALADEAGLTLIELAIAFVINHPAVTAAIIGPRTLEHLETQLTAADVTLSSDVLDRIDEIVEPGVNLDLTTGGWTNPALAPEARRR